MIWVSATMPGAFLFRGRKHPYPAWLWLVELWRERVNPSRGGRVKIGLTPMPLFVAILFNWLFDKAIPLYG